jgi:hypothetical protein
MRATFFVTLASREYYPFFSGRLVAPVVTVTQATTLTTVFYLSSAHANI